MHPIQQNILNLARNNSENSLSLRAIGKFIGEKSAQKVKHHIEQLESKGLIVYNRETKTLKAIKSGHGGSSDLLAIPILGAADAGPAIQFAEENLEGYLRISQKLVPRKKGLFAIRVFGNSMNRASIDGRTIDDGDYVIIDPNDKMPGNGDCVLSVIDGVANIKRFHWDSKNQQVVLSSESTKKYPPIYIHPDELSTYLINGKVVSVLKKAFER
jgi:SOS-response transcriptional repressor LexA